MPPRTLLPAPRFHRAAVVVGYLLVAACGEPAVGGSGRFEGPGRVVLEGSPHQMGWWHGRLLRDRVRNVALAFPARVVTGAVGEARAKDVLRACRVYAGHALGHLPERVRQELDGLSAATGVAAEDLLLPDLVRDALRWHEGSPRLLGGALAASPDGTSLSYRPEGPDAEFLHDEWIVVDRRPLGAGRTVVVSLPGSMGGVLGAGDGPVAIAAAEDSAEIERQTLGGVPFPISLRLSLERARSPREAIESLSRTTAHRVVAVGPAAGESLRARLDRVDLEIEPASDAPLPDALLSALWLEGRFDVRYGGGANSTALRPARR